MGEFRSAAVPRSLDGVSEDARLAALHAYSGLAPDDIDSLSRLSRETACSLGATHAAISFVDDARVWFAGAFGFAGTGLGREYSFCDAVVRGKAPLLVCDAPADPVFRHHTIVDGEPGMRSYAGAPLIDPDGHALGTVAAYSTRPAAFGLDVLHDLGGLAGLVRDFLAESRFARPTEPDVAIDEPPPALRVRGWLGVKTLQTDDGKLGRIAGLTVLSVAKGSPASQAGLRPTDIIQSIGGQELFVSADVAAAMTGRISGSLVQVRFRRAGQSHRCGVEIRSRTRFIGR